MTPKEPRIQYRKVGNCHLFTSPDIPGLYVAHEDAQTALDNLQPSIDLMLQSKESNEQINDDEKKPVATSTG